jgi:hypothetical protein
MEDHMLRVFENRMQKRVVGAKKDKVMKVSRKLHNEEFHNIFLKILLKSSN